MGGKRRENMRLVTEISAGTLELGVSVGVGALLGYWLDSWLHTAPWMTLLWLVAGVIAGFRSLIRVMRRLEREQGSKDQDGEGS